MRKVALEEVTTQVETWNPAQHPERHFSYIDLSSVSANSKVIASTTATLGASAPSRARQMLIQGDVLVSTVRPYLNAVATVESTHEGATASTGFTVLRPSPDLDGRYLFHWVRSPEFIDYLVRNSTGASYPAVSDRIVKTSRIPLPPLDDQQRIAAILDQAAGMGFLRRGELFDLRKVGSAAFDALRDLPGTRDARLGEVASLHAGGTLPAGRAFREQSNGALLMKVSDMNTPGNEVYVHRSVLWTASLTPASSTVQAGAVVIPKRGASIGTNKKRLTTRTTVLDPNVMGIQPYDSVLDGAYLHAWFQAFDLRSLITGSSVPQLNKQDLAPLNISIPPITAQREFAARVAAIDEHCDRVQRAIDLHDELFASLQSRAFKGEL